MHGQFVSMQHRPAICSVIIPVNDSNESVIGYMSKLSCNATSNMISKRNQTAVTADLEIATSVTGSRDHPSMSHHYIQPNPGILWTSCPLCPLVLLAPNETHTFFQRHVKLLTSHQLAVDRSLMMSKKGMGFLSSTHFEQNRGVGIFQL
jgi:hypothetical protein